MISESISIDPSYSLGRPPSVRTKGKRNRIGINVREEDTRKIVFADEKMFDMHGVDSSQND